MDDAVQKLLAMLVLDPSMFNQNSGMPQAFTDMANAQQQGPLGYSGAILANLGLDKPNFGYNGNTLPVSDMSGAMFGATRPPETPTGYQSGEASFNDMPLPAPNPNASEMTQDPVVPSTTSAIDVLKNLFPEEPAAPITAPTPAPTPAPAPAPAWPPAMVYVKSDGSGGNWEPYGQTQYHSDTW